ncbi:uncharacterized protein LOC127838357 isoform X2 [Dreissena polymorpha]|uniref:uncharacterized protein LOC127838357 isoform X2 n=1 Tax=Dreissena polymorpha TaxID=45954 RepID=UPI0022647091|nr:uncharacterized protein LOC127838357 isoform X2 [Dreissena polymorpha]
MVGNKDGEIKCKEEHNRIVEPIKDHAFSSIHGTEHIDCFEGVICQKVTTVEEEVSLEGKYALGLNGNVIANNNKENNNIKIYVDTLKNQGSISLRNEDYALEVMEKQIDNSTRLVNTETFEVDTLEVDQCVGFDDNNDTCEVILNDEGVQCVRSTKPYALITCDWSARCESVVVPELSEAEHCTHVGSSSQSEGSVIIDEVADVNDKVVGEAPVEIMIEHTDEVDNTDVGKAVVTGTLTPNAERCSSSNKHDVGEPNGIDGNPVLHTSHSSDVTICTVSRPVSLDDSLAEIFTAGLPDDLEIKDNQDPNIDGLENERVDTRISECSVVSSIGGCMTSSQLAEIDWNSQFPTYSPEEQTRDLQQTGLSPVLLINETIEQRETTPDKEATESGEAILKRGLLVSRGQTITKETSIGTVATLVKVTLVSGETFCKKETNISGKTTLEKEIPMSAPVTIENGASVPREASGEKGAADFGAETKTKESCNNHSVDGSPYQHKDGSAIVRGIIHELSQMNKLLLRTKRDMETSHRKRQK